MYRYAEYQTNTLLITETVYRVMFWGSFWPNILLILCNGNIKSVIDKTLCISVDVA